MSSSEPLLSADGPKPKGRSTLILGKVSLRPDGAAIGREGGEVLISLTLGLFGSLHVLQSSRGGKGPRIPLTRHNFCEDKYGYPKLTLFGHNTRRLCPRFRAWLGQVLGLLLLVRTNGLKILLNSIS